MPLDPALIQEKYASFLEQRLPPDHELQQRGIDLPSTFPADATWLDLIVYRAVLNGAMGDQKAITDLIDRMAGKARQYVETVNKNYSYTDFMLQIEQSESAKPTSVLVAEDVVDVTADIVDVPSEEPLDLLG